MSQHALHKPCSLVCNLHYETGASLGGFKTLCQWRALSPPSLNLLCVCHGVLSLHVCKGALYMSSNKMGLLMWGRVTQQQQVELRTKIDPLSSFLFVPSQSSVFSSYCCSPVITDLPDQVTLCVPLAALSFCHARSREYNIFISSIKRKAHPSARASNPLFPL